MTQENKKIIQTLQATKERLFEKGWRKESLGSEEGPNCIVGAIGYVSGMGSKLGSIWGPEEQDNWENRVSPAVMAIAKNIECLYSYSSPAVFNDRNDTTFDDVIDLIDKTIKSLESI